MQTYQDSLELAKKYMNDPAVTPKEAFRHLYYVVRRELAIIAFAKAGARHDYYTAKLNEDLSVLDLRHDLEKL